MNLDAEEIRDKISQKFYYGWLIVIMGALGILFSGPGQTYSISIFINSYIEEFGWSRSMVSSIYSSATLISGLLLSIMGYFVDKHGQKKMSIIVGIMLGVACIWSSLVINPLMLFLGFFMMRYFGQGSMVLIPNTLIPQWFLKKRALALSLMGLGGVIGSAIIPPLNNWIIINYSWQTAWRMWAFLLWIIFVPIVIFVMHNKPEDIGLLPDNEGQQSKADHSLEVSKDISEGLNKTVDVIDNTKEEITEKSWTLKEAMKTRSFWLMLFALSIPSMIGTGITFHLVSILGEQGLAQTTTAFVLSVIALVSFPVTFLAGFILDRVKVNLVIACAFALEFITIIIILNASTPLIAIIFGVVTGFMNGFLTVSGGVIWPNYFGREYLGSIRGITMTSMVIGSAFGPLPFGFAFDTFGGYREILLLMAIFPILGLIASLLAPNPNKENLGL